MAKITTSKVTSVFVEYSDLLNKKGVGDIIVEIKTKGGLTAERRYENIGWARVDTTSHGVVMHSSVRRGNADSHVVITRGTATVSVEYTPEGHDDGSGYVAMYNHVVVTVDYDENP